MQRHDITVRQLSQKTGVRSKTLRYWEGLGLLSKPARTHTNYRLYRPEELDRVVFIQKAKSLGFTLSEIRRIFELCHDRAAPCEEVVDWAGKRIETLNAQIKTLSEIRSRLIQYHRKWNAKGPCPPMRPNEICRLIEEVPLSERQSAPYKGGDGYESKEDCYTMSGLRKLSDRRIGR